MDPTNKTLKVTLFGEENVTLYFNANMQMQFEEYRQRFFMDWFVELHHRFIDIYGEKAAKARKEFEDEQAAKKEQGLETEKLTREKLEELLKLTQVDALMTLRLVSMKDFIALLAAAWHTYDSRDEPEWAHSPGSIAANLDHGDLFRLFPDMMRILFQNFTAVPDKKKAKVEERSVAAPAEAARPTIPTRPKKPRAGGQTFGPSESAVLGSLRKRSGG